MTTAVLPETHQEYPHPHDRPLSGQPHPDRPFHFRLYACEWAATMMLMIAGVSSNVFIGATMSPAGRWFVVHPALLAALEGFFFGFSSTIAAFSPFGRVSGAHLSPSISVAFALLRRLTWRDCLGYVLAQTGGAVSGVALVALAGWIWPFWGEWCRADFYAATFPYPLAPPLGAAAGECGATAILVGCILYTGGKPPLRFLTAFVAGPLFFCMNPFESWLSGDSTNLARSIGPAIFADKWQNFWVYIVGPFAGVLLVWLAIRVEIFGELSIHEARRVYFGHDGRAPYLLPRLWRRRL